MRWIYLHYPEETILGCCLWVAALLDFDRCYLVLLGQDFWDQQCCFQWLVEDRWLSLKFQPLVFPIVKLIIVGWLLSSWLIVSFVEFFVQFFNACDELLLDMAGIWRSFDGGVEIWYVGTLPFLKFFYSGRSFCEYPTSRDSCMKHWKNDAELYSSITLILTVDVVEQQNTHNHILIVFHLMWNV